MNLVQSLVEMQNKPSSRMIQASTKQTTGPAKSKKKALHKILPSKIIKKQGTPVEEDAFVDRNKKQSKSKKMKMHGATHEHKAGEFSSKTRKFDAVDATYAQHAQTVLGHRKAMQYHQGRANALMQGKDSLKKHNIDAANAHLQAADMHKAAMETHNAMGRSDSDEAELAKRQVSSLARSHSKIANATDQ